MFIVCCSVQMCIFRCSPSRRFVCSFKSKFPDLQRGLELGQKKHWSMKLTCKSPLIKCDNYDSASWYKSPFWLHHPFLSHALSSCHLLFPSFSLLPFFANTQTAILIFFLNMVHQFPPHVFYFLLWNTRALIIISRWILQKWRIKTRLKSQTNTFKSTQLFHTYLTPFLGSRNMLKLLQI